MSQVTKRALVESLKRLLLKKPLNKITVTDITEDCGISRMTFYYHFQDSLDLVEWTCMEDVNRLVEDKRTKDTWQEGYCRILCSLRENQAFVRNLYHCISRERVEQYLLPMTDGLVKGVVEEESAGMIVSEEDKAFIARVYGYILVGLTLDWVRDEMKEDPSELAERLARVVQGGILGALGRLRLDQVYQTPESD